MAFILQEGHLMPSRGQSVVLTYIAWDTSANAGKSGDVANHTLRWIKDGTSAVQTNSPSEIDATNAPGAYKLTLTAAECTCDTGTLVGKSSTANVSIIPVAIAFEQLPTATPGANAGVPILDSSLRIDSNIKAIDGNATNGNNATLKLKSLDLRSNDTAVAALEVRGANGGAGLNGGKAFSILGGSAGTGGASGGDAIYALGGSGISSRGFGLNLDANTGGSGLKVKGEQTFAAIFSGYNGLDIRGNIVGDISGSVGSISTVRPKKNTGLDNFMFPMFDATTKNPKAGLTVTAERAIDGNPFATCSNSAVELSNGVYRVSLSAGDLNGDKIMFRFSATGADDQLVEIITQD